MNDTPALLKQQTKLKQEDTATMDTTVIKAQPVIDTEIPDSLYEHLPMPSRLFETMDVKGVTSISKYEIPFSALARTVHRKLLVPTDSKFISFMLIPYLEYEKKTSTAPVRKFFDMDRTPKDEEMAAMKKAAVPKLVFVVFAAVYKENSPMTERGIVIAKTRESLSNFNLNYYIGSAYKNYTTHYHAFALQE